jgi:hypothetical protein
MPLVLNRRHLAVALASAATVGVARSARAGALAVPTGKVILTISGKIGVDNGGGTAVFDRDMLEAIGMVSFTTGTPWTDGPVTFEGVPMDKLMAMVAAQGDQITALALNDYSTDIPIVDFARYHTILALKRDGEYMPVRDKGPLFIVYPYDSNPELKHQMFYSRSAWQLSRIVVK